MQMRTIGAGGPVVSAVGLGCNMFGAVDLSTARAIVHQALDLGVTVLETADYYGHGPAGKGASERYLGEILGPRRKDVFLASKFGLPMDDSGRGVCATRAYVAQAVDASLARLKTDYIDLYQLHHPDPRTPLEETLEGMDDVVRAGKVRFVGFSNHSADAINQIRATTGRRDLVKPICAEDEYSILVRYIEGEHLDAMRAANMGLMPYFPLASGLLTGKYVNGQSPSADTRLGKVKMMADRYMTPESWTALEKLQTLAAKNGRTLLEYAVGWLLTRPFVSTVVCGATRADQVAANVKAAEVELTAEEIAVIDGLATSIGKLDVGPVLDHEKDFDLRYPSELPR